MVGMSTRRRRSTRASPRTGTSGSIPTTPGRRRFWRRCWPSAHPPMRRSSRPMRRSSTLDRRADGGHRDRDQAAARPPVRRIPRRLRVFRRALRSRPRRLDHGEPRAAAERQRVSELRAKIARSTPCACSLSRCSSPTRRCGERRHERAHRHADPEGVLLPAGADLYFQLMRNLTTGLKSCLALVVGHPIAVGLRLTSPGRGESTRAAPLRRDDVGDGQRH